MKTLNLNKIKNGLPGITPRTANHLYEACMVCLHRSKHKPGVIISLNGEKTKQYKLNWKDDFNEVTERTYQDQEYTTEHGAICISAMLAINETDYTIIERSKKRTGFDYWLGLKNDLLFRKAARLEISGIFKGNIDEIEYRYKKKVKQTEQSDSLKLPAYISIVEFSNPLAKFQKK